MTFYEELQQQRWDDHRYYHQSRINQTLHLLSAVSFLCSYVMIFINPVVAVLIGWIVAMILRQAGHFFFEPKDYDKVNEATHQYKEEIKVGYNLKRKVVLLSIWIAIPAVLYFDPTFFGLFEAYTDVYGYLYSLSMLWLTLGGGALLFRTVHLFFLQNIRAGLVWFTKILTDPVHDIKMYHKSPFYLLKGELLDPMTHVG
ncbi:MAG: hypothetical protein PVJ39_05010 [Gammaproteobacteria bacterium]|jgi:hypothetical protein